MADEMHQPKLDWASLRIPAIKPVVSEVKNANELHENQLKPLQKLAIAITEKVGSMGFFVLILTWTVLWCGYNILATLAPGLGLKAFDPFPAFVAYLLMSNVIQILLMPLIMVGQNLQGQHSEIRAQLDFEINQKAEKEIMIILNNLQHNTDLILQLMKHLDCRISDEELRALMAEKDLSTKLEQLQVMP